MAEPTYHCDTGMRYLAFGGIPVGKYSGGGNAQAAIFAKNIIKQFVRGFLERSSFFALCYRHMDKISKAEKEQVF